jgi:hypothetical protein
MTTSCTPGAPTPPRAGATAWSTSTPLLAELSGQPVQRFAQPAIDDPALGRRVTAALDGLWAGAAQPLAFDSLLAGLAAELVQRHGAARP